MSPPGTSRRVPSEIAYYFRRLLPFLIVFVGYEAIEVGTLAIVNHAEMDWSLPALFRMVGNLAAESSACFLFLIAPYLLYLLALPATFHGSKTDRRLTLGFFLLFCLINATEEALEIASDDRFSFYTLQFLHSPNTVWAVFVDHAPLGAMAAAIVLSVAAAFFLLRKLFLRPLPAVPTAFARVEAVAYALALGFLFSLGGSDPATAPTGNDELAQEGIFSFFGDLFAVTPMPNLHAIFLTPALAVAAILLLARLLRPLRSRLFALAERWLPRNLLSWKRPQPFVTGLFLMLAAILIVRLASLSAYPLMDTTEARYAEMARKMLETGNWLTPQIDYGVPFWGKPPLSFWASALTMSAAGIGAWGARLAPFLASVATGLLFFAWPFATDKRQQAVACWIVTAISGIGFVAAGAVMTDQFLAFGLMLAMVSFRRALEPRPPRVWGYLFFIGLAVGLLSKGPLCLVLAGLPLFLWLLSSGRWRDARRNLPWIKGGLLLLALVLPWYALAERATPGFLNYFLAGEHFHRFIDKGWQGDLYGSGHARAIGTIWLYGIAMFLPWSLLLPFLWLKKAGPLDGDSQRDGIYLLCWAVSPFLFFTLARNILPAYVLPAVPPLAILTVQRLWRLEARYPGVRFLIFLPAFVPVVMAGFVWGGGFDRLEYRCQRDLLKSWDGVSALYYADEKRVPYSAQFYSQGKARLLNGEENVPEGFGKVYVAVTLENYRSQQETWEGWKVEGAAGGRILLSSSPKGIGR